MQHDLITIVACGESAQNWIPRGYTIGLNDSWKFGKPTDALLCCNRPQDFTPERLRIITSSTPEVFYSHKSNWAYAFPEWKKISLCTWYGTINKGQCYSSNSSPFIAISLAYQLGAKDIILWGCDMINHHVFNKENPYRDKEVETYMQLIRELHVLGTSVFIGTTGTAFDGKLDVYDDELDKRMDKEAGI